MTKVKMIKSFVPAEIPNGTEGIIKDGYEDHVPLVHWNNGYVIRCYPHEFEVVA